MNPKTPQKLKALPNRCMATKSTTQFAAICFSSESVIICVAANELIALQGSFGVSDQILSSRNISRILSS
jgi:hypothetical protein